MLSRVMPTVLRINGWRVVIYLHDHPPAHVHVLGAGWVVVINVSKMELREVVNCDEREALRVLRVIEDHQPALVEAWRRLHG